MQNRIVVTLAIAAIFGTASAASAQGGAFGGYGGRGGQSGREVVGGSVDERLAKRFDDLGFGEWVTLGGVFRIAEKRRDGIDVEVVVSRREPGRCIASGGNSASAFAKIVLMTSRIMGASPARIAVTSNGSPCNRRYQVTDFVGGSGRSGYIDEDAPSPSPLVPSGLFSDIHGELPKGADLADVRAAATDFFRARGQRVTFEDGGTAFVVAKAVGMKGVVLKEGAGREDVDLYVFRPATGGAASDGRSYWGMRHGDRYSIVADGSYEQRADGRGGMVPFEPGRFAELDAFARAFGEHLAKALARKGDGVAAHRR